MPDFNGVDPLAKVEAKLDSINKQLIKNHKELSIIDSLLGGISILIILAFLIITLYLVDHKV